MCALILKSSQCPDGKIAEALASTLACTTVTNASVVYRRYVPQRLKFSHRPDGRLTFCLLLAGRRWCLRLFRHGHDNVFLDLREHSVQSACSCPKFPIAPMGDSRFARCLQGGGVYVRGGTVSIVNSQIYSNTAYYVRAHLHNFPSGPPWDALL